MTETAKRRYRCPSCGRADGLYANYEVPGWRSLTETLEEAHDEGVEWSYAWPTGEIGCGECDWMGTERGLVALGTDEQPLPPVIPGQVTIEEAIEEARRG